MDDAPRVSGESNLRLRKRLEWFMLSRVVLVTLVLGSAIAVNVNATDSFGAPSYLAMLSLIVATYVATIGYGLALRRNAPLDAQTRVQLIGDSILVTGLIFLTGGIDSIFTFFFFINIFAGAILLGRFGSMFVASLASVGLTLIVLLQLGDFGAIQTLMPSHHRIPDQVPVYAMIIHLVSFFTVAALSGTLAENLGQVGSELEKRQLDIRELRALNENIIRSLASGLVTLDLDGHTVFMNAAATTITGRSIDEVVRRPVVDVIPEFQPVVDAISTLLGRTDRPQLEVSLVRPDGAEVYLGVTLTPLRNAQGTLTGTILIVQDVTELKTMRDAMLRQEHLSAIGKLSAAIAHEIRNPLAAISGSIQMLRESAAESEEDRILMDIVVREVDRLNVLIEDFLAYARPTQIRPQPIRVNVLLQDAITLLQRDENLTRGIEFELGPEALALASEVWLEADLSQMQQVIWNLLRNACEAMPRGGVVTLGIELEKTRPEEDEWLIITVQDQGAGLPESALEHLFEPFFTTKKGGTGLGLASCHRIVGAHGGELRVENIPDGGARFSIVLPAGLSFRPRADSASIEAFSPLVDPATIARTLSSKSQSGN